MTLYEIEERMEEREDIIDVVAERIARQEARDKEKRDHLTGIVTEAYVKTGLVRNDSEELARLAVDALIESAYL